MQVSGNIALMLPILDLSKINLDFNIIINIIKVTFNISDIRPHGGIVV
jgi:hypothetical protein